MGPVDFSAFEHEGWERIAQTYHKYFGDLAAQSNHAMLEVPWRGGVVRAFLTSHPVVATSLLQPRVAASP